MYIGCHWLGLDPPPLREAYRNLVLLSGSSADQHYQLLTTGKASGPWKETKRPFNQMPF